LSDFKAIYSALFATGNYGITDGAEWREGFINRHLPGLPAGAHLLEIGPGRGRWLKALLCSRQDLHITTWDLADFHHIPGVEHMDIDLSQEVPCIQDIEPLDVIVASDVLEHIPAKRLPLLMEIMTAFRCPAIVTVANHSDIWEGIELHLTKWSRFGWSQFFRCCWSIAAQESGPMGGAAGFLLRPRP